ncbi:endonuclease/exonuclease/phosphatase family protein [Labilibaculum antarcticum]|uniref:Endonuclease/exonuclease/phosphatase n=1 Tax=Labilibaculum antarcticum TaxID=1717717 RepID=A0A1Y1CTE8_9BACT|nr:endonuclease/exonuclease/phosphatase family protein [Labilibaculum antarcticum]BAX82541.1 endonuclease/exonuclease/phosphatase [Labilibaculum antarcticum]
MKKYIFLLLVLFAFGCTEQKQPQKFMTYNLRYDNPNEGVNRWDARKSNVVDLIAKYSPDVFGTQEGLHHQLAYLDSALTDYSYVGVGRDDGKKKGEYCAVFYKPAKYDVVQQATFWLSETPEEISVGWDAVLERICTYLLLENKQSGERFYVFNTHFDHIGEQARQNSSKLIYSKITESNPENYPCVLMGDFNLTPETTAIQYLSTVLDETKSLAGENILGPQGSFNAFKHAEPVTDRIDYIFISKGDGKVNQFKIIDDQVDERYPSDHLPVFVEIEF